MRRVKMIYVFRRLTHPSLIKVTALVFFGTIVTLKVSLLNVYYNTPRWNDAEGLYNFYLSAFKQTEIVIKMMVVGLAAAGSWLMKDLAGKLGSIRNVFSYLWSMASFGQIRRYIPLLNRS